MEKKKKIIMLVVGVSIALLALIGGSFAYFTAKITSSDGETVTAKATTIVNVNMEYGGVINSEGMYPGHKLVKTIHVTGSGEANAVAANVTLTLTPNVSDFPNHVRYTLYAVEKSTIDINSICGSAQNEAKDGKYYDSMECDTSQLGEELKTGIFIDKQVETLDIKVEYNTDKTYYVIVEYINDTEKEQNNEQGKTFTIHLGYTEEGYAGEEKAKPTATIMTYKSGNYFWSDTYRENTTKVVIEPSLKAKENAIETFDVSEAKDGSVMAYLVANESDTSKYTLYLQGENGILANSDSSYLFMSFSNLTTIDGIEYLDTSNVINMIYMFYGCSSLTSLDVSPFDTSNVTIMYRMFYGCSSLTNLDLSHFDTSKVTNMQQMFSSCSNLASLDVSHFDTSNVTNMSSMFSECSNLTSLDLSNFDTSKVTDMTYMFSSMPTNAIVKVRNTEEQAKILNLSTSYRPSWTTSNVVVAS